tara:strand:- start:404 stop:553 length:150 start_codon:yes stop_codon:yes gene_type:complete
VAVVVAGWSMVGNKRNLSLGSGTHNIDPAVCNGNTDNMDGQKAWPISNI